MGGLDMSLGQNFPISDYYQNSIIDAETVSRSGGWWTAVILIADPRNQKPFITIYRWQKTDTGCKNSGAAAFVQHGSSATLIAIGRSNIDPIWPVMWPASFLSLKEKF